MSIAIHARDLRLDGRRGPVYGPLDLDVPTGTIAAVIGGRGSGRTALLLTLTGRMKSSDGVLTVLEQDLPRHRSRVQRRSAIAGSNEIDALDSDLSVGEVLREQASLLGPWWRPSTPSGEALVDEHLRGIFDDIEVPSATTHVWGLADDQLLALRIALALMSEPDLLAVDDVDQVVDPTARARLASTLTGIAAGGITVLQAGADPLPTPLSTRLDLIPRNAP